MRDKILFLLFRLGHKKIINQMYLWYYHAGIVVVSFLLNRLEFVKHAYLKGSFGKEYFVPVISDLDFFICGDVEDENTKRIARIFKYLNFIFPFISDFDFHSEIEMDYLRNHAGLKFYETYNWKKLKGEDIGLSYKYHPRKFQIDIIHEIYFQFEWLFKNLKKRKNKEKFVSVCIQRQYLKILDLINFFQNGHFSKTKLVVDINWFEFSNEKIIEIFNGLIIDNERIRKCLQIYQAECYDINLDQVLCEKYYQEHLVFIEKKFIYQRKNHYFFREVFELFFYTGCIDSYMLLDWVRKSTDELAKLYINALYYAKLIENRNNSRHTKKYFNKNVDDALSIKNKIYNYQGESSSTPKDLFNKNICLIPLWEPSKFEALCLEFFLNKIEKIDDFEIVIFEVKSKIKSDEVKKLLKNKNVEYVQVNLSHHYDYSPYQHQNILNLGINWCFGANIIFLWDAHVFFKGQEFVELVQSQLKNYDFILPYSEVKLGNKSRPSFFKSKTGESPVNCFLWAAYWKTWKKLGYIIDVNLDIQSNELFYYSITSQTDFILDVEKVLQEKFRKINLGKFSVCDLDCSLDGIPSAKKESYKETTLRSLVLKYLTENTLRAELGFWRENIHENNYFRIKYFLENLTKFTAADLIFQLNELSYHSLANFGEFFCIKMNQVNNNCVVGYNQEYALLDENSNHHGFRIYTGKANDYLSLDLFYEQVLDENIADGNYLLEMTIKPEQEFDMESLDLEFLPSGLSELGGLCRLKSLDVNSIYIPIVLPKERETIQISGKLHLRQNTSYEFSFSRPIHLENDLEYEFFYKVPSETMYLGELPRGIYKIYVRFSKLVTDNLKVKSDSHYLMKTMELKSVEEVIIYLPINTDVVYDATLSFENNSNFEVVGIDILKGIIPTNL